MNRMNILNDVKTYLSRFTEEVKNHTASSTYDINIHAENVLIPLLNKIYGVDLKNFNSEKRNYPAIDLYDNQARLAIQVTSDSDSKKISETISKFVEKQQYTAFDRLIIYIISNKQDSYRKDFNELTKGLFDFNVDRDIIDNSILSGMISNLVDFSKITEIHSLLMGEFSDLKINERSNRLKSYKTHITERLLLNFIKIEIPPNLYYAITTLDEDEDLKDKIIQLRKDGILPYRRGGRKNIRGKDLVMARIYREDRSINEDFILFQDKLYTFRNLYDSNESLREVIDIGTIEIINSADFYQTDENYLRKYKELLKNSLKILLKEKGIEWIKEDQIFRFSAFGIGGTNPERRKVSWTKETKSHPRTVVEEVQNKTKARENQLHQIVCFKHLAFSLEIEKFDEWYVTILPTWSYTNPGGVLKSRFESKYLSGIKQLENNEAVQNHFLFISNCLCEDLKHSDLNYIPSTPYDIKFIRTIDFKNFAPAIIDSDWLPRKINSKNKSTNQITIEF